MVRALILSGYGINCERESAHAFELAGAMSKIVHVNDLISKKENLKDYQILMFPGGFSYGDDTGAGNAFANKIKNNLWKELTDFIDSKKLILGVCNGFQIMTHLGLFSNGVRINSLESNTNNRYECRWVNIFNSNKKCVFTKNLKMLHLPVAHGEGRFTCKKDTYDELVKNNQIVFKYCKTYSELAQGTYPENPNGSIHDIAAICDKTGKIMGMMPHPERAIFSHSEPEFHLKKEIAKRTNRTIPNIIQSNLMIFINAVNHIKGV